MRPTTLCFPVRPDGKLLLGRKKRGFGVSKRKNGNFYFQEE